MRQVIAEVSVVPIGTGEPGVSKFVAACLAVLDGHDEVKFQLTPMGTVLQGELGDVLALVKKMHEVPFGMGAQRVVTTIKIDDRTDKAATMESKVNSVIKLRPQPKVTAAEDMLKTLDVGPRHTGRRPPRETRLEDL